MSVTLTAGLFAGDANLEPFREGRMKALALAGQTNGFGKRASKRQTTQNSGWPDLGQGIVGQNTTNNPAQGKHWTLQKFYFSIPKHK